MPGLLHKLRRFLAEVEARVDRHDLALTTMQQETQTLRSALERLTFEVRCTQEQRKYEREKFQLRIENELLKSGRQLSPKAEDFDK